MADVQINEDGGIIKIESSKGKSTLHLGKDNIVHATVVGEFDGEAAALVRDKTYELMENVEGKVNVIAEIENAGKQSPEARQVWCELCGYKKTRKVAIFGLNPVAKVLAAYVIGTFKRKNLRFFGTEQEALAWLNESE